MLRKSFRQGSFQALSGYVVLLRSDFSALSTSSAWDFPSFLGEKKMRLAKRDIIHQNLTVLLSLSLIADIHYFHCQQIVEILKRTEASTKNIFGRYSSQRMKASEHGGKELHL